MGPSLIFNGLQRKWDSTSNYRQYFLDLIAGVNYTKKHLLSPSLLQKLESHTFWVSLTKRLPSLVDYMVLGYFLIIIMIYNGKSRLQRA